MQGPDLSVFQRQKTIVDQQQLQDAFELKKALAIQGAQRDALEMEALRSQAANGGLTLKDMMTMQMQQQNQQATLADRQQARQDSNDIRMMQVEATREKGQDKKDLKFKNDQNALTGILMDTDQQIEKIKGMFDEKGALKKDYADNYGTTFGIQGPVFFQSTQDARTALDNVVNNSVFQKLGDLKAQSATGASGLGSLSNSEGTMLKSAATPVADYKQSPKAAEANLKSYLKQLEASRGNFVNGFRNIYGEQAQPTNNPSAPPAIEPAAARAELARRAAARKVQ
jgi:hypothetical protein